MVEEEFMGGNVKRAETVPITRICLTGGPCAGKTTALAELTLILNQMGFRVLQVPEAQMTLRKGGISQGDSNQTIGQKARFIKSMMKLQMEMEQIFINIAQMST